MNKPQGSSLMSRAQLKHWHIFWSDKNLLIYFYNYVMQIILSLMEAIFEAWGLDD